MGKEIVVGQVRQFADKRKGKIIEIGDTNVTVDIEGNEVEMDIKEVEKAKVVEEGEAA